MSSPFDRVATVPALLIIASMSATAAAVPMQHDDCEPRWVSTFGGQPGMVGSGANMAVFDDGSGPALYMGGNFESVGGIPIKNIARRDGSAWSQVGDGLTTDDVWGGYVSALTVFDDGSGPALFAAGFFTDPSSGDEVRLAKWDGGSWSYIGADINNNVFDLLEFDDGSGNALYVCGLFSAVNGVWANKIAKWDGEEWSPLGDGLNSIPTIRTLAVHDDGTGAALYAGGNGWFENGVPVSGVAKWSGTEWLPLEGLPAPFGESINTLAVFDDGLSEGSALIAAGDFSHADGIAVPGIAQWDGTSWTAVGEGLSGTDDFDPGVHALAVFDDGSGPALYAGGHLIVSGEPESQGIAKWNGVSWSAVGGGVSGESPAGVHVLQGFDDGSGPALFAHGHFERAGNVVATNLARWQDSNWESLGGDGLDIDVFELAVHDDGSGNGPALYAAGDYTHAGGEPLGEVIRWDGSSWTSVGDGPAFSHVVELESYSGDEDSNPLLFAGGLNFGDSKGYSGVAIWDGSSWTLINSDDESNYAARALELFDDGSGLVLYAAGEYLEDGFPRLGVTKWDGTEWLRLGAFNPVGILRELQMFDDGSGPSLYVAGRFTTMNGSSPAIDIARWNGSEWTPLGSGLQSSSDVIVNSMTVFDDGSGPALFVGGDFDTAGEVPATNVAKWDGEQWSAVGDGLKGSVSGLAVFDDGTGPALYAGGIFSITSDTLVRRPAKWDGTCWTPVGTGTEEYIFALAAFHEHPSGKPSLYAGGNFSSMVDSTDSYIARYEGCPILVGDINSNGVVDWRDLFEVLLEWGPCLNPGACRTDVNNDGIVDVNDLLTVLGNWT